MVRRQERGLTPAQAEGARDVDQQARHDPVVVLADRVRVEAVPADGAGCWSARCSVSASTLRPRAVPHADNVATHGHRYCMPLPLSLITSTAGSHASCNLLSLESQCHLDTAGLQRGTLEPGEGREGAGASRRLTGMDRSSSQSGCTAAHRVVSQSTMREADTARGANSCSCQSFAQRW